MTPEDLERWKELVERLQQENDRLRKAADGWANEYRRCRDTLKVRGMEPDV